MKVERIQHVGICVPNLDEALAFYCGIMGFTLDESRPDFGIGGCWLNTGTNQLHLLELADETPGTARHLAFQIDDLDAWTAHLTSHGVAVQPLKYFPGAGRQVFLKDPSGNSIELNQPDR
jgi:glyoxylase I family protein